MDSESTYTAFAGQRMLANGDLRDVLSTTKEYVEREDDPRVLIFEDTTGRQVEFDLSGALSEMLEREAPRPRTGPGRPKLGVVSREVSLLPRHWEWLELQPSGISAALRRLVEEASKREPEKQVARKARDATGRVMAALAGNLPGYEEALRALYAADVGRFRQLVRKWPADIRAHLMKVSEPAFAAATA